MKGIRWKQPVKRLAWSIGKQQSVRHGAITKEYIDDIRRDVLAMSELAAKLIGELAEHPIPVTPTYAFSPASIGKGYLRAMGIKPILKRQPNFPKEYLGYAQTAFFGGRTSVHVRKVVCPVVYVDFLSMYSTINSLMGLWRFVIAGEIRVIEHCKDRSKHSSERSLPTSSSSRKRGHG